MTTLYELAIMGAPSEDQIAELRTYISQVVELFGLRLGDEVAWSIRPGDFRPAQKTPAAVAFFGAAGVSEAGVNALLRSGVPILPVASADGKVNAEIPAQLKALNCLAYATHGPERISTALLECVGLLPHQRRVFVSYRRDDARQAALQLFNALSARLFDVFLDTHGIAPAEDFQAVLWHRLCDSDALVMLDTPGYFDSRWTSAEFGRAVAKGISVLRIGWPNVNASPRASTASRVDLTADELDATTGELAEGAIKRICTQLEFVRGQSHAVRSLNLFSNLKQAVECIGGVVSGVGVHNGIYVTLPDGKEIVVYPTVRVAFALRKAGVSTRSLKRVVQFVRENEGIEKPLAESRLVVSGRDVLIVRNDRQLVSALSKPGQGCLSFVVDLPRTLGEMANAAELTGAFAVGVAQPELALRHSRKRPMPATVSEQRGRAQR